MTPQIAADVSTARAARVVFLHHSVGADVLAGVERLDHAVPGPNLRLESTTSTLEGPVFLHGPGGQNELPRTKIDAFASLIARRPSLQPDLALMKLCYIDIDPNTDVDDLFAHYSETMRRLARAHPGIRFGHVTAPLTSSPTGLKAGIRRVIGMQVWEDDANVKRHAFNVRLRADFGDDPIFDLAAIESTGPDGTESGFVVDGTTYPSLDPRYTDDGGHLNELGEQVAAAAFLRFVAEVVSR